MIAEYAVRVYSSTVSETSFVCPCASGETSSEAARVSHQRGDILFVLTCEWFELIRRAFGDVVGGVYKEILREVGPRQPPGSRVMPGLPQGKRSQGILGR